MTDPDIVARLREQYVERLHEHYGREGIVVLREAADEIERLRRELGQVSDADPFVSEVDAAHLDSLLEWCEFNAMDWHRALARLVADRADLRKQVIEMRSANGR